jgi:Glycine cleavage system T protein (aminomethyltransferase)
MHAKYVILCNEDGGVLNDPVLLRLNKNEFWFSLADSDLMLWLQGVNVGKKFAVEINEIDVAPVQIQGPKSEALMVDLLGQGISDVPVYGLMEGEIDGCKVIISQSGFSGEKGYEIYLIDATLHAEKLWNAVKAAGKSHNLMVIAPAHHRRIAAGILSWGQDADFETSPFQCNLGYQVPRKKSSDYVGKEKLNEQRDMIESGTYPFKLIMVGIVLGGKPIEEYAPDFWTISLEKGSEPVGYITSPMVTTRIRDKYSYGLCAC